MGKPTEFWPEMPELTASIPSPLTLAASEDRIELENASPFLLHKRSDYPPLGALTNQLLNEIDWDLPLFKYPKSEESFRRQLKNNLKSILIDLLAKYVEDPAQYSAMSRNHNDYTKANWLHKGGITRGIIDCADTLHKHGYIDLIKGISFEHFKRNSRIRATEKLLERFYSLGGRGHHFYRTLEDTLDLIRFKEPVTKRMVRYEDTTFTSNARELLLRYNVLMSHHKLTHPGPQYCRYAPLRGTTLHRIFNGSWKAGGRYFGSPYQMMKSEHRKELLIDGQRLIEIDYSATHISIYYNLIGRDYWFEKQDLPDMYADPYYFNSYNPDGDPLVRGLNKLITNTYLQNSTRGGVPDPFEPTRKSVQKALNIHGYKRKNKFNYPNFKEKLPKSIPFGLPLKEYMVSYLGPHGPYSSIDFSEADGLFLMFVESEITTEVIRSFTDAEKPLLVIHDSFMAKTEDKTLLDQAMKSAWTKILKQHSSDGNKNYLCKVKIVN